MEGDLGLENERERQRQRVVAHFDLDCFYAQVEENRRPEIKGLPVGVTQKFLVVTCNYEARKIGVPKMSSISKARSICPEIILINGEDLTPYRAASKKIMAVLKRFGTLERLGLDEAVVDITSEVFARIESKNYPTKFFGHLYSPETKISGAARPLGQPEEKKTKISIVEENIAEEKKNEGEKKTEDEDSNSNFPLLREERGERDPEKTKKMEETNEDVTRVTFSDLMLMSASQLAEEMRGGVEGETGYRCSCGIANSKMLAKLVSSLHKPNAQTSLQLKNALPFIADFPVRKLPGVGERLEGILKNFGVEKIGQLQKISLQEIQNEFGEKMGSFLFFSSQGLDFSLVKDKGLSKSLSVEDSFPFHICTTFGRAENILETLAPDLIFRLDEEKDENFRIPKLFV